MYSVGNQYYRTRHFQDVQVVACVELVDGCVGETDGVLQTSIYKTDGREFVVEICLDYVGVRRAYRAHLLVEVVVKDVFLTDLVVVLKEIVL